AAVQRLDALEAAHRQAFAMLQAPAQLVDRDLLMNLLQYAEDAARREIERSMHTEWPALRRDQLDHLGELFLHDRRLHHRIFGEVGVIASRPHRVLARAAQAEIIVALVELRRREPALVILDLAAGALRHQRVADAYRQRLVGGE